MKLSEGLTRLKHLKSKATQVAKYVNSSVSYFQGDQPEYNYLEELENYKSLNKEIRFLKTRIQCTNVKTKTSFEGVNRSLTELILLNAELRSDLSFVQQLQSVGELSLYVTRTRDDVKKVYAEGFSKKDLRSKLEFLEDKREKLEGILASVNSQTEIVEL